MVLYDGGHYPEALEAFTRVEALADEDLWSFCALVWQGHVLDLLGRREEAVLKYRQALERDTGGTVRHDQYGMKLNRAWVEQRLEVPFRRN
jgi:tetratricopeptide (TPR) repeat protein